MKRIWLLLVLLAVCLPAAATDMYSWTDANGVKHFADAPPAAKGIKAQKLKVRGGVTTNEPADAQTATTGAKAGGPALAAAAGYAPDDIKRNCEIAKKNLATLQTQQVAVDADGNPLDPDAARSHQAQIDKADQQTRLFCPD